MASDTVADGSEHEDHEVVAHGRYNVCHDCKVVISVD